MRPQAVGRGPLFPDDSPLGDRVARRARALAIEVLGFALLTALLPLLLPLALVVDVVRAVVHRRPAMAVRLLLLAWWLMSSEAIALLRLVGIYAMTGGPFGRGSVERRRRVYGLRIWWCSRHFRGGSRLLGLRLHVDGLEQAAHGPVLIMSRHASIIDTALPDLLLGGRHGIGIRVVMKRELEQVAAIDIGGRWIPSAFVRRGSGDTAREVAMVRGVARELGRDEAVLIFPEGTRTTPQKLARAKQIVAERQPELAPLAERLQVLLPPRLNGPLALLEEAPGVDVVFLAHTGLDGFVHLRDLWDGKLLGTDVHVHLRRVPAADVPRTEPERTRWLYDEWQRVDAWVAAR